MQKKIIIESYIDKLSSNSPTPGGGSAAALAGALSSALTAMVFNLTIGKKVYENYTEEIKSEINDALYACEKYNELLLEFMDKDEDAFLSLMKSFKLSKTTEEEKKIRNNEIAKGYKNALEVPLALATKGVDLYKYIDIAARYGNANVISDAGVGAILLYSSIESSILNVKINLSGIMDEEYKNYIEMKCSDILKDASEHKSNILQIVYSKIS